MYYSQSGGSHFEPGSVNQPRGAVKIIIIACVAVFVLTHLITSIPWFFIFGLVPRLILTKGLIWQPFTYLFLHADVLHLIINMLLLWMFGAGLEQMWGTRRFLAFFFFCGVGAGISSMIFAFNGWSIGASGAIFGLLVAYGVLFPEAIILLFFLFPMKMKHAVIVLCGINLLAAIASPGAEISYIAQLGGGVCGFLFLKNEWLRLRLAAYSPVTVLHRWKKRRAEQQIREKVTLDIQVDRILDKISRQGVNSLSKEERRILEKKSRMG